MRNIHLKIDAETESKLQELAYLFTTNNLPDERPWTIQDVALVLLQDAADKRFNREREHIAHLRETEHWRITKDFKPGDVVQFLVPNKAGQQKTGLVLENTGRGVQVAEMESNPRTRTLQANGKYDFWNYRGIYRMIPGQGEKSIKKLLGNY